LHEQPYSHFCSIVSQRFFTPALPVTMISVLPLQMQRGGHWLRELGSPPPPPVIGAVPERQRPELESQFPNPTPPPQSIRVSGP
jgi:hypothetical protein